MQVQVNGEIKTTDAATVAQLIREMGMVNQAVAVELNRQVVPKRKHEHTPLTEGDTLEVVTLVGGG